MRVRGSVWRICSRELRSGFYGDDCSCEFLSRFSGQAESGESSAVDSADSTKAWADERSLAFRVFKEQCQHPFIAYPYLLNAHAGIRTTSAYPTLRLAPYVGLLRWRAFRTRKNDDQRQTVSCKYYQVTMAPTFTNHHAVPNIHSPPRSDHAASKYVRYTIDIR